MSNKINNEIIEKYLLGEISDETQLAQVEAQLAVDEEFSQRLEIVEDDLIEKYINNELENEKLFNFKKVFLTSRIRRNKIINSKALNNYVRENIQVSELEKKQDNLQNSFWSLFSFSPKLAFTIALPVVLLTIVGGWFLLFDTDDSNDFIAQIDSSIVDSRPFESRVIDFKYLPYSSLRGEIDSDDSIKRKRRILESKLLEVIEENKTTENFNDLGVFYLIEKKYDEAINQLIEALRISESNTEARGNLGVAYFEQSNKENELDEKLKLRAKALEEITKAIKDGDERLELLFNRALILQAMNMPRQAILAWEEYLEKDNDSKWAVEARKKLEALKINKSNGYKSKEEVLEDFITAFEKENNAFAWKIHSQTKEVNTQKLIPMQLARSYLDAIKKNDTQKANLSLKALKYIGEMEKENNADVFFSDLADYYSNTDSSQKQKLYEAHKLSDEGLKDLSGSRYGNAITNLKKSHTLFISAANIWEAGILEVPLAFCLTRVVNIDESNKVLDATLKFARHKKYRWLLTTALDWKTSNLAIINETSKAIATGKESLQIAEDTGNIYGIQRMSGLLSELHIEYGEARLALRYLARISALDDKYNENYKQAWRNNREASDLFGRLELYEAAIIFANEYVNIADELKSDQTLLRLSYYFLSRLYFDKGDYDKAKETILKADAVVLNSDQSHANLRHQMNSKSLKADIKRKNGNCKEALNDYNELIEYWTNFSEYTSEAYFARKGKLLCLQEINQKGEFEEEEFEKDINIALKVFQEHRLQLVDEEFRNVYFHNEQTVYDIAVEFALSKGESKNAFKYSEESKARSLLDYINNGMKVSIDNVNKQTVSIPLSLDEIQKRMPKNAQLLQYALLRNKMVVWIITNDSFETVEKEFSSIEFNKKLRDYLNILKKEKDDIEKIKLESSYLFDVLIAPIYSTLDKEKDLFIVNDKALHRLPFASLFSKDKKKYLIEDFAITNAPSSSIFVINSESAMNKSTAESIISIGNPSFDKESNPQLDNLESAKHEALLVSEVYKSGKLFLESNATKENFLNEFEKAEIVHYAGHYVANENHPLNSKLLMAKSNNESESDLRVADIVGKKGSKLKLVVLSACQTEGEQFFNGEGAIGAARIFLGIGSPIVVASHFEVDSESTANLMINFHKYRKKNGMSIAKALQKAQKDAINELDSKSKSPFYWSAFSPTGGYTNY